MKTVAIIVILAIVSTCFVNQASACSGSSRRFNECDRKKQECDQKCQDDFAKCKPTTAKPPAPCDCPKTTPKPCGCPKTTPKPCDCPKPTTQPPCKCPTTPKPTTAKPCECPKTTPKPCACPKTTPKPATKPPCDCPKPTPKPTTKKPCGCPTTAKPCGCPAPPKPPCSCDEPKPVPIQPVVQHVPVQFIRSEVVQQPQGCWGDNCIADTDHYSRGLARHVPIVSLDGSPLHFLSKRSINERREAVGKDTKAEDSKILNVLKNVEGVKN